MLVNILSTKVTRWAIILTVKTVGFLAHMGYKTSIVIKYIGIPKYYYFFLSPLLTSSYLSFSSLCLRARKESASFFVKKRAMIRLDLLSLI